MSTITTLRSVLRIAGTTEDGRAIQRYVVLTGYLDGAQVAEWFDAPVGPSRTARPPDAGFVRVPQRRPFMGTLGSGPFWFYPNRHLFELKERDAAGPVVAQIWTDSDRMRWGSEGRGQALCGNSWRPIRWRCVASERRPVVRAGAPA